MTQADNGPSETWRGRPGAWVVVAAEWMRAQFVTGLRVLAPFIITYVIFRFLYNFAAGVFEPLFLDWFGHRIPGLGMAILILGPMVVGAVVLHLAGGRPLLVLEGGVARIPVIGPVFATARQFVAAFGGSADHGFQRVVEIEYPRKGVWTLGFYTDRLEHEDGSEMAVVYIPTAPTPNTGYLALVPVEDVWATDLTIGDAMRTLVSAGVSAPRRIHRVRGGVAAKADESPAAVVRQPAD